MSDPASTAIEPSDNGESFDQDVEGAFDPDSIQAFDFDDRGFVRGQCTGLNLDLDRVQNMAFLVPVPVTQTDTAAALKEAGLQVTAQRLSVYRCVDALSHATADVIAESVRGEIGAVSRQAVYDALAIMSESGLIRRFQPAGSSARYETRTDNHHHLICRVCGSMLDVDCAKGRAPCLHPVEDHGYCIDEAEVIYWGICPDCQSQP